MKITKTFNKIILLILGITLLLVGCTSEISHSEEKKAKEVVNEYLKNIKNGDKEAIENLSKQIETFDKLNSEEEGDTETSEEITDIVDLQGDEFYKKFFGSLKYKISDVEIKENVATVKTNITNIDMSEFMGDFLMEAMEFAVSSFGKSEEEINKGLTDLLASKLDKKDIKTVSKDIKINLEKKDGSYRVIQDKALLDAVSGGLSQLDFSEMDFD